MASGGREADGGARRTAGDRGRPRRHEHSSCPGTRRGHARAGALRDTGRRRSRAGDRGDRRRDRAGDAGGGCPPAGCRRWSGARSYRLAWSAQCGQGDRLQRTQPARLARCAAECAARGANRPPCATAQGCERCGAGGAQDGGGAGREHDGVRDPEHGDRWWLNPERRAVRGAGRDCGARWGI